MALTTDQLPAALQYDPNKPHECGHPDCPLGKPRPADATGVSSET